MTDGVNVDWNLLKTPDFVGDYTNAFRAGRQMAQEQGESAAGAQFATDPTGGANAMMAYDPSKGAAMMEFAQGQQDRAAKVQAGAALAGGDYAGAAKDLAPTGDLTQIAAMNTAQKAAVMQHTEMLGAVMNGLAGPKYRNPDGTANIQARLSVAQHLAATQPAYGIKPEDITADMVSDQGLAESAASLKALERAAMTPGERQTADKPFTYGKDQHVLVGPDSPYAPQPGQPQPSATPAAAPASPLTTSPQDRIALAKAIYTEAAGEPPEGQAAVGHVILNRANAGYGGARSIADVVNAPGQFEGMTTPRANIDPNDPRLQPALAVADQVLSGQTPDPTGGADHFLNPVLQGHLGRAQPAWATGNGQRIGNHVFYGGQGGGNTAPYQVASTGATPPPPTRGGYVDLNPDAGQAAPSEMGHVATPAELKAANLPASTRAWFDPKKGVVDLPKGIADQPATDQTVDPNAPRGLAFLHSLPIAEQALVRAYAEGRAPIPTGAALRNPMIAKAFADAAQYDPGFDAASYPARAKARSAFTSGQPAANITSANTLMGHLDRLDKSIDALGNSQSSDFNAFAQNIAQRFGNTHITAFNSAKQAVATELARTFQGGAPHETEIQGWLKQLNAAQSPQQLHGVVQSIAGLVASRINALGDQYNQGMGTTRDGLTLLRPDAAATLARLANGVGGREAAAQAAFYQKAETLGMTPPEIDKAWQDVRAHYSDEAPAQTAPKAAPSQGGVRYIGPA